MENNFQRVIPVLPVSDVGQTVTYYREVLGYTVSQEGEGWGSALRGTANFYFSKTSVPTAPLSAFVWVDEVDNLCTEFRAQGATITEEPDNKPWGYRQFTLQDPDGHQHHYFRFADGVG